MTDAAGGAQQRPALARPQDGAVLRRRRVDRMMHSVLLVSAGLSVLIIALVVVFLGINARPVLSHIGLRTFFGSTDWAPDGKSGFGGDSTYGALSPILGSLVVVGGALVVAVPVAVCAALFLEETNPLLGERYLRPAVELFVGIPSVVYGYLGFIALLPILRHLAPPGRDGSGLLAGAVVLGVMIVPTIATLSADGLRAVPRGMREASLALGATRWQTMRRVLLPAARPGIVSGIVLGLARAMGEALAVALVIGDVNTIPLFRAHGIRALIEPWTTMTVTITDGVNQVAINPDGTAARYMLALVLLVITFACIVVVRRVQRPQEVAG